MLAKELDFSSLLNLTLSKTTAPLIGTGFLATTIACSGWDCAIKMTDLKKYSVGFLFKVAATTKIDVFLITVNIGPRAVRPEDTF